MQEHDPSVRAPVGSVRAVEPSTRARRPEPISPELALVDPVARSEARAALPDEPWNLALERALGSRIPMARTTERAPAAPTSVDAAVERDRPRRPRAGAAAARRLALVAAWAVLVTSLALLAEARPPNGPAVGAEASTAERARTALATPVPNGGYVIGRRSGFRIGPQGRAIGSMTLPVKCLWGVRLPRVEVTADKGFSYRGLLRGTSGQRVRVRLAGRFVGPRAARGTAWVEGKGCSTRAVTFVARLS
jgi:hypothetical protein